MRLKNISWLSMAFLAFATFASLAADKDTKKFVQPTKDDVGVYKNDVRELYEKPLFTVGSNDRLSIISSSKQNYKVQTASGETGWVEKRLVVTVSKSKTFVFDDAEVIGYLDNPTPVYIIDADNPNADPIKLDRSFADALRENVDKETVERQVK
ncbi:MAG: SH3 domain-containing protein [Chitinivibrionales bacterium]